MFLEWKPHAFEHIQLLTSFVLENWTMRYRKAAKAITNNCKSQKIILISGKICK